MVVEKNYKKFASEYWFKKIVPACVDVFLTSYLNSPARINAYGDPVLGFVHPDKRALDSSLLTTADYISPLTSQQFELLGPIIGSPGSGATATKVRNLLATFEDFLTQDKNYSYMYWLRYGMDVDGIDYYLPHYNSSSQPPDWGSGKLTIWDVELSIIMAQTANMLVKPPWPFAGDNPTSFRGGSPRRSRTWEGIGLLPPKNIYVYAYVAPHSPGAPMVFAPATRPVTHGWAITRPFELLAPSAPGPGINFASALFGDGERAAPSDAAFRAANNLASIDPYTSAFVDRVARNFPDMVHRRALETIDYILRTMEQIPPTPPVSSILDLLS